jgi:large subunit ribosomal protein L23
VQRRRNFTSPGNPYNPYEASSAPPSRSLTKTDVRLYFAAVYGPGRTNDIHPHGQLRRAWNGIWAHSGNSYRTYKRAVVGLVEPFYYPMLLEDMSTADREAREKSLDEMYFGQARKDMLKAQLLQMTRKSSP